MTSPDPVTSWTQPPMPEPSACPCGETVGAIWIEPIFGDAAVTGGRPLMGTGCWASRKLCNACEAERAKAENKKVAEAAAVAHGAKVQHALTHAGFEARELPMTLGNLRVPAAVMEALQAWTKGEKALYLHGKDTGTGKTHAAVGALKRRIGLTGERGLFRPVPLLVKNLRQAVGRFRDGALIDELTAAPCLVLDDMGVERPTETVLEGLYTIIDDFYRRERATLIITSNLPIEELSKRLDDRIASRIVGLCRVIEFSGPDRRLPGFEDGVNRRG